MGSQAKESTIGRTPEDHPTKRSPVATTIRSALLGAVAGAALYHFVNGPWDSQGWLAVLLMAVIFVMGSRRNRLD